MVKSKKGDEITEEYDADIKKSTGLYPGLITYIKSEFDPSLYEQTLNNNHVRQK